MVILKIFKQNEEDIISTLFEGDHIIGRDEPLNSEDKRISRKHAIISVKQNGVTLKSIHANPCYFRSPQNNVEKLEKNNCVPLNDGDQFSMLADSDWFSVKIIPSNSIGDEPETFKDDRNKIKRSHGADNFNRTHKRVRPNEQHSSGDVNHHQSTNPYEHELTVNPDDLFSNLDNIFEEFDGLNRVTIKEEKKEPENSVGTEDDSNRINPTNEQDSEKEEFINRDVLNTNYVTENCSVDPRIDLGSSENDTTVPVDNTTGGNSSTAEICSHVNEHQVSPMDQSTEQNVPIQANTTTNIPPGNIKQESALMFDANVVPSTSIKEEPVPEENIKQEPVDNSDVTHPIPNIPPISNDQNNVRRDRCWYGHNCYRRNPAHRLNISHPGDNDYDSDPNDVRAICPYGRACYRVNPQHRREFKHYGKPAPKPINLRVFVNVNNTCPCSQCRNHKPGYESDYGSGPGNCH